MPTQLRRELIDLGAQRAPLLQDAENALHDNNHEAYTSAMQKITNLNTRMTNVQNLIAEKERNFTPVTGAEARDMIEDRANTLMTGESICFDAQEVRRGVFNAVTIGDGITQPAGAGTVVNDRVGVPCSSIIDQVSTIDLTGVSSWQEPYVISTLEATGGDPNAVSGKPRSESEAKFGVAELRPYDVSVTAYVDRNISNLTPTAYYQKVYSMAMDALRRKLASLIPHGDGAASPIFYGITTAKNKKGENIFAAENITGGIGVDTLDDLYYAYGDDEFIGGDARLLLTKPNLKALGKLRGTNEKRKLFNITREFGNANIGMIEDGGTGVPFTLLKAVGDDKLLYGDPKNFLLALFGGFTVRIDESYKAGERLITVLGDVQAGGNLTRHNGFVVGNITAAAAGE